ncbi:MAG: tetratricopeptide repeat protein, partial [Gemmataceae bacterium]|nr:tetratricopeptide repeat protein [Gemmataceae bacterium]
MEPSSLSSIGQAALPPGSVMVRGKVYEHAIGPKLRVLLAFIFLGVALLGATGFYLLAIRIFEWVQDQVYQTQFSLLMVLVHVLVGVVFIVPFVFFGCLHLATARHRKNRLAVRLGITMFITGLLVVLSGLALIQLEGLPQIPTGTLTRAVIYWLHIILPIVAVGLYVLHRRAGPDIQWKWGAGWGIAIVVFAAVMIKMHSHDPRQWYAKGSPEGEEYYEPSKARTVDGNFLSEKALMMDEYCMKCHQDIYNSHIHSVHKFSSFNNPAYLFSVKETRQRAGVRASRWCAGCHDPVPFFTGQFDDPNYNMVNHPTAKAGITCTVCHSITHIGSRAGNADYTIEEPIHYPFAFSDNPFLQYLNNQLIKAKPEFHKKTFLKPFHRSEAFCSTCHKVGLPQEVTHYKEFLRGQNHNDSYWLSGVSGYGARSFYYPKVAKTRCAECHMPLVESNDFGSRDFDGSGKRKIHNHFFPGANTGLAALLGYPGHEKRVKQLTDFLTVGIDGKSPPLRVDIFGLKFIHIDRARAAPWLVGTAASPWGALAIPLALEQTRERGVEAPLIDDKPLRPHLPTIAPGGTYQAEVVVRTVNMGHHFTQGTVDSNEVWVDFQAKAGGRVIARSGGMSEGEDKGRVDPWAHFFNVFLLDRNGNRIDRRNPQDIFTPLYDHQIPPGAAAVLHYRFTVPRDLKPDTPIELSARVRYRKFDYTYMHIVYNGEKVPQLPIVDMCSDNVILPVAGFAEKVPAQASPIQPAWQRWNDYGIGCFLEGGPEGKAGGELKQAELSFGRLVSPEFTDVKDAHGHGWLNLARVHLAYGGVDRLEKARQALIKARAADPPAPWWTVAWFNGVVNLQNANFDDAILHFQSILNPANQDTSRNFDFTKDYIVINELGKALFFRSQREDDSNAQEEFLRQAIQQFEGTLRIDPDNVDAHEFLNKCYSRLVREHPSEAAKPSESWQPLCDLADKTADVSLPAIDRIAAAQTLAIDLSKKEGFELAAMLYVRAKAHQASIAGADEWLRLAVTPVLFEVDRRLLDEIPKWSDRLAESSDKNAIATCGTILEALRALSM